ncbi:hypothetical protein [Tenacibaculum mesophilum]|uniref:hypothetical protein n=1 Tax=Tenacibaculum mesophilum TaxID=104268 RepID=UPI003F637711
MKGFNLFLNILAAIIIGIAVIGILAITIKFLDIDDPKTNTIKIEYHGVKTDSINELNKIEIIKIDSLLNEIKETSNNIQKRQLNLIEDKENDNFFNKLYAAIVAIILAIAGFFGFKSTNDIRSRAIEEAKYESIKIAKETAENSAKEEFNRIFDEEYKGEVFEEATKASSEVLRKDIGRLEKIIFKLTSRLEKLETKEEPEQSDTNDTEAIEEVIEDDNVDPTIDETENPFDNA